MVAFLIYEWKAWTGFLLPSVTVGAIRMKARIGEAAVDVMERMEFCPDYFAFHTNLTLSSALPSPRHKLIELLCESGVKVINGFTTDISKSALHRACDACGIPTAKASPQGEPAELLIIKTEYNYRCWSERQLTDEERDLLGYNPFPQSLLTKKWSQYSVVRRRFVRSSVWTSPHHVVERYVTNSDDCFYRAFISGSRLMISKIYDPAMFKKMPEHIKPKQYYIDQLHLPTNPLPRDVVDAAALATRVSAAMRLEFGALDIVSDDEGQLFVIDANTTPFWGEGGHPPRLLPFLRGGLLRE